MLILKLDQTGTVSWQKTYGGIDYEYAFSIQQTRDGGYIVAGSTKSFGAGDDDMLILKLDQTGTVSWQKAYGGIDPEAAYSIQQTSDGGYIVAGYTFSFGAGDQDMWILKLDQNGNVSWQKTYGGGGRDFREFTSIQQTRDGGYIVAGATDSFGAGDYDGWILKLDQTGTVSWQKTYGGSSEDTVNSIQQTSDGGYIVAGVTYSFGAGSYDLWILKLDQTGTVSWQKTYGGSGTDAYPSIRQTSDGGYIVAGLTGSFGVNGDMWILKLDQTGMVSWQKTFGGSDIDFAASIQQTTDGGYIVAGYYDFGAGNTDMWILKLDSNGNINNCGIEGTSDAIVTGTSVSGVNSNALITIPSPVITDTSVIPQSSAVQIEEQCFAGDWFPMETPSQEKLNGVWGYSVGSTHKFYTVGENGTSLPL